MQKNMVGKRGPGRRCLKNQWFVQTTKSPIRAAVNRVITAIMIPNVRLAEIVPQEEDLELQQKYFQTSVKTRDLY